MGNLFYYKEAIEDAAEAEWMNQDYDKKQMAKSILQQAKEAGRSEIGIAV